MDHEPQPRAVDICAFTAGAAGWNAYFKRIADAAPKQLRVFARPASVRFGVDTGLFLETLDRSGPMAAADLLTKNLPATADITTHLQELDNAGITHEVIHGVPDNYSQDTTTNNQEIAQLAKQAPHRISAWAGISLNHPDQALHQAQTARQQGHTGLTILPAFDGIDPLAPQLTPIFTTCETQQLPVWLHTGQHFATNTTLNHCTWHHIDQLATRHPQLRIIVGHGGWPWIRELTAVALRHQHVYLDTSTHRPKHFPTPGNGWDPLIAHANRMATKVLFGSCAWVLNTTTTGLINEMHNLPIPTKTTTKWLHTNATNLLNLNG